MLSVFTRSAIVFAIVFTFNKFPFKSLKAAMSSLNINSTIKLNDGYEMHLFGLGVYEAEGGESGPAERAVLCALQNGYRMIDTAQYYRNEEDVGKAIKKSGVPRENVYVVTKQAQHGYNVCRNDITDSLKKLDLDYIDLYLIHWPTGGKVVETYKAMVEYQKKGVIRSIGVSNFGVHHLEALKAAGCPTPAVNQIHLHPFCKQEAIVEYCKRNGIAVMGYSPLTRGKKLGYPALQEIAKKYNTSPAQILLRWGVQSGYITIPKSEKPERIISNADIYNFNISPEDMQALNNFPNEPVSWNPVADPWEG
jgi:diketogulonate reductase-like aldo/keto reductase